jgi:hypothetical protein
MALVREYQSVLNSTASLQDVWILGVIVAFADDIRGAKFELFGQRGGTCPLNIFGIVIGAGVFAAHYIDFVEAFCVASYAGKLGVCKFRCE